MHSLEVDKLPREAWIGTAGSRLNLTTIVEQQRPLLQALMERGFLRQTSNFGFAAAHLLGPATASWWNDPYAFTWFVTGWGTNADQYIANAVRKLRPTLRLRENSLDLVDEEKAIPEIRLFADSVASREENGSFAWGDFPFGGAILTNAGSHKLLACACSGFAQAEDEAVSLIIGSLLALEIRRRSSEDAFN